jgi:hypothetical protein
LVEAFEFFRSIDFAMPPFHNAARRFRMRKSLIVLAAFLLIAGCGNQPKPGTSETPTQSAVSRIATLGHFATDPFAQMAFTFEGNPTPELIKEKIDKVLELYGMEVNDANRSEAGRILVGLRKEHGHSEMAILAKMLESPANGAKFEEAAAKVSAAMNQ